MPQGQQSSSAGGPGADLLAVYLEKCYRSWIPEREKKKNTLVVDFNLGPKPQLFVFGDAAWGAVAGLGPAGRHGRNAALQPLGSRAAGRALHFLRALLEPSQSLQTGF